MLKRRGSHLRGPLDLDVFSGQSERKQKMEISILYVEEKGLLINKVIGFGFFRVIREKIEIRKAIVVYCRLVGGGCGDWFLNKQIWPPNHWGGRFSCFFVYCRSCQFGWGRVWLTFSSWSWAHNPEMVQITRLRIMPFTSATASSHTG